MAGGGGTEPNLTPFIDLFSVLICFLLMTAAWLQLESLQVTIEKAPDPNAAAMASPPPPEKEDKKPIKLSVHIFTEKLVTKENDKERTIQTVGGPFDQEQLKEQLAAWKKSYPDKRDIVLHSEGKDPYGTVIQLYDFLTAHDFPDVGINPN